MKKGRGSNKPTSVDSLPRVIQREAVITLQFMEDLRHWSETDRKITDRVFSLVESVMKGDPFTGIGKPERLKYYEKNTWSRRIDETHRLVYEVDQTKIIFLQARYHYSKE